MRTEWVRQFSLPDGPADEAVFETVVTAHGVAVASGLLNKHRELISVSSEGLIDCIEGWIQQPIGWQTAWDLSFGRAHLALKDRRLDPVEAAVRVGLRIASSGHPSSWSACISPMCVLLGERYVPDVTAVRVDSTASGQCCIRFQLKDGFEIAWSRNGVRDAWSGDGGERLEALEWSQAIHLISSDALPAEDRGGEIFKECHPVAEVTMEMAQSFRDGFIVLERNAPQYLPWVERVLAGIVVASRQAEYRLISGSWEDVPGFVHISSPHHGIDIAEILVHECAHQYFYMLQRVGPVDDSTDGKLYWSPPIRKNRPLSRILMAYHALANVQILYEAVRLNGAANSSWEVEYVKINEPDLQAALCALDAPLRGNPALTAFGRGLYEPLADRISSIFDVTSSAVTASEV